MAEYKFTRPWKFGSETIESVQVKEQFTAGDMRILKNTNARENMGDFLMKVIQVGTGYTETQAEMIPAEDFDPLTEFIANFMPGGKSKT